VRHGFVRNQITLDPPLSMDLRVCSFSADSRRWFALTVLYTHQLSSELTVQRVAILYNGPPLPPKIARSHGGSEPPCNTWFLGPTRVLNPNGISIGSAVFAGLTTVKDRPTDRPRYSVCKHVRSTAMRPKNNKWSK